MNNVSSTRNLIMKLIKTEASAIWIKLFKRKKKKIWKTDAYYGDVENKSRRGHISVSGAILVGGVIESGEIYYHRDMDGNVLVNKDENGRSLL